MAADATRPRDSNRAGDMYELLEALRDVEASELAHNPVGPAAPEKRRLLALLERLAPYPAAIDLDEARETP